MNEEVLGKCAISLYHEHSLRPSASLHVHTITLYTQTYAFWMNELCIDCIYSLPDTNFLSLY